MNSTLERETDGSKEGRAKMMVVIHERNDNVGQRRRGDGSEVSSLGYFFASIMPTALIFCNLSCVQCKITDLIFFILIGC